MTARVTVSADFLRVLVVAPPGAGTSGMLEWIRAVPGIEVREPAAITPAALDAVLVWRPEVVVLDLHGTPAGAAAVLGVFRGVAPAPIFYAVAHDTSGALRRHCRAHGIGAVFDRTRDLDLLAAALQLHATCRPARRAALAPADAAVRPGVEER